MLTDAAFIATVAGRGHVFEAAPLSWPLGVRPVELVQLGAGVSSVSASGFSVVVVLLRTRAFVNDDLADAVAFIDPARPPVDPDPVEGCVTEVALANFVGDKRLTVPGRRRCLPTESTPAPIGLIRI
jgi:hypothetical protein